MKIKLKFENPIVKSEDGFNYSFFVSQKLMVWDILSLSFGLKYQYTNLLKNYNKKTQKLFIMIVYAYPVKKGMNFNKGFHFPSGQKKFKHHQDISGWDKKTQFETIAEYGLMERQIALIISLLILMLIIFSY